MPKLIYLTIYAFLFCSSIIAQPFDTLKVMQYNILNYRSTSAQCDASTNNAANKELHLTKVIDHSLPDILVVNEMGADFRNSVFLLDNALNKNGRSFYREASFSNRTGSNIVNMLFYNENKLSLYAQEAIYRGTDNRNLIRQADVYHLYDKQSANNKDTIFFSVIAVHLKAGSTTADRNERARQTEAIMNYLQNRTDQIPFLIAGDFNVQSSSETAYNQLVSSGVDESIRFYDPKEAPGSWNNNRNYANLHTQSTRNTSTNGGCFSGGGMDDRYDFILINKKLQNTSGNIYYLNNSYQVLGQDGQHFNLAVNQGQNYSVPQDIANALYEVSDHLPVSLELLLRKSVSHARKLPPHLFSIKNPSSNHKIVLFQRGEWHSNRFSINIHDLLGRRLAEFTFESGQAETELMLENNLPSGYAVIQISDEHGYHINQLIRID